MKQVNIFTDGACKGNPGPGGWGAILDYKGTRRELSDGEPQTTNNRMELSAVIAALSALTEPCEVTLTSDSKYVVDKGPCRASGKRTLRRTCGCCRRAQQIDKPTHGKKHRFLIPRAAESSINS